MHIENTRGEEREKNPEVIFQAIMIENFPKLTSDTRLQIRKLREHEAG